LSDSCLGK